MDDVEEAEEMGVGVEVDGVEVEAEEVEVVEVEVEGDFFFPLLASLSAFFCGGVRSETSRRVKMAAWNTRKMTSALKPNRKSRRFASWRLVTPQQHRNTNTPSRKIINVTIEQIN